MYTFPVGIELDSNYLMTDGIKIPVKSGMSITTNIKLREKRLISVVSDLFNDNNYDALQDCVNDHKHVQYCIEVLK